MPWSKLLGLLLLGLLGGQPTNPAARPCTVIALSSSEADVQSAINQARNGAVICVPAGTSNWPDGVFVTNGPTSAFLIGAGQSKTVITGNGVRLIGGSPALTILGMTLPGSFPVQIQSSTKRYLVDAGGSPFPIFGFAAWGVVTLSPTDYRTFLDDRAQKGYTAIEMPAIVRSASSNPTAPFNGNGDLPFLKTLGGATWTGTTNPYGNINTDAPDFTTPNNAYWSYIDTFFNDCASRGLLVFTFPSYYGFETSQEGWWHEMVANGQTNMQTYGAWFANRYKNQANLVFLFGGDNGVHNAFTTAEQNALQGLLTGLRSVSTTSLYYTAEWDRGSIASEQSVFGSSMTVNGTYAGATDINNQDRRAWAATPTEPAFLLEAMYDEAGPDGTNSQPTATQPCRRFQAWPLLSAIGGYVHSNDFVWPFDGAGVWKTHLNTQTSLDMKRINAFIQSIAWWNLVPSATAISSGGGTLNGADEVTIAVTRDNALAVSYLPPAHTGAVVINMNIMRGTTRARWEDPTAGTYTIDSTGLANSGTHSFTTPGTNSAGGTDWFLVLDS
jgi:hypothetical protein